MAPWFNSRKAAQIVAFFAREQGGNINVLKLMKLVYIADRRNMEKYDFSISGDVFVSMDHGPLNSITYNCVNAMDENRPGWDEFVTDRAGNDVGLARNVTNEDLDELSIAELETLKEVWADFGAMGKWDIRNWTHENCPEWEDPKGGSSLIPYARVFKFLNKPHAKELESQVMTERALRAAFAKV